RPVLGRPLAGLVRGWNRALPHSDPERPIEERHPLEEVARRDAIFRRSLAVADMVAAALAVLLCVEVLGDDRLRALTLLSLPLVCVVGKVQGVYDRDELLINKTTIDQAPQLFQLATLYALVFVLLGRYFVVGTLGTTQVLALWGTLFVFALLARGAARAF